MSSLSLLGLLLVLLAGPSTLFAWEDCERLKHLDYELFGTKTIYSDAQKFLRTVDDKDLPKPFDDDPLEKEHLDLLDDHCKPVLLYFVGRHSARFPDSEDIEQYNKDLYNLVERLKSSNKCAANRQSFLSWRSKMVPSQDNLITELGAREEKGIARGLKKIYPEFFNAEQTDISIGVTKKIRTAQTAAQFLTQVDNLKIPLCADANLPTNDVDRSDYNLEAVKNAACYNDLVSKYTNPILDFHKQCEDIQGNQKIKDPTVDRVKKPELKKGIADKVARKLGLDNSVNEPPISQGVLDSIYNMCKFENAIRNDSIWCNLFDKRDIQAFEYIDDVNGYFKDAYGSKANARQSCPVIKDLLTALHHGQEARDEKRKAFFYFTHADPIKKLLATLHLFSDEEAFSESRIRDFEDDLIVPSRRNWRGSVVIPFSGNLEFILYKCQKRNKPVKFKILTAVNQQTVKIPGCDDEDCKLQRFLEAFGHLQDCDLNKICAKNPGAIS